MYITVALAPTRHRYTALPDSAKWHTAIENFARGESLAQHESCTVQVAADGRVTKRSGTLTVSSGSGSMSVTLSVKGRAETQESLR